MDHAHQHEGPPALSPAPPFWRSRYSIGLLVLGAAAGYFLISEHRAHFLGALPFLILLACPLMHVFMHGGHGGHSGHGGHGGHGSAASGEGGSKALPRSSEAKKGEQL